jgi:hypothetical protein
MLVELSIKNSNFSVIASKQTKKKFRSIEKKEYNN